MSVGDLTGLREPPLTMPQGAIPVTVLHPGDPSGQNHTHGAFSGTVLFKNEFNGRLSAAEYPKITVSPSPNMADLG